MTRLTNKVAIITGCASGIGEGTVRKFVTEGAKVVIADVQDEAGVALQAELGNPFFFNTPMSLTKQMLRRSLT